jgi:hypothetical protein
MYTVLDHKEVGLYEIEDSQIQEIMNSFRKICLYVRALHLFFSSKFNIPLVFIKEFEVNLFVTLFSRN